jgi:flagellin-specific chaperone FliS
MKHMAAYGRTLILITVAFLTLCSHALSQDLFRETENLKTEIAQLRSEVNELKSLVYELRRTLLKSGVSAARPGKDAAPPETVKPIPQKKAAETLSDEQLTAIICSAIGKFYAEADTVLSMNDASAAESRMNKALETLDATLDEFSGQHRVSKLMDIYEGLAWDTLSAVRMRGSITGNENFTNMLARHRQKYRDSCRNR